MVFFLALPKTWKMRFNLREPRQWRFTGSHVSHLFVAAGKELNRLRWIRKKKFMRVQMSQNWGKITAAACSEQNGSFFGPPKTLIQFYLRKQRAFCACQGVKNTGSMDGAFKQSIAWASTAKLGWTAPLKKAAASNSMCVGCVLLYTLQ